MILVVAIYLYLNQKAGSFGGERVFLFESESRLF